MLRKARSLAQQYTAKQLYDTALFWADKALTLSNGNVNDLASYIQTLYLSGQYQRAVHTLQSKPFFLQCPALKYLAARCHAACKEWDQVITLLKPVTDEFSISSEQEVTTIECPVIGDVQSASLVLQGEAYERLGNLHDAVTCYKEALMADVFCEEALERLSQHYSLTSEEERSLFSSMPFKKQCSFEEERMLKFLYQTKLRHGLELMQEHKSLKPLYTNLDVLCSTGDRHFRDMNTDACYHVTSNILRQDPYHNTALLLHIACCIQNGKADELFSIGNQLVNYYPHTALPWYAVGCYYIVVKKHQSARKYLTKSVSIDAQFAPAHMAFGFSFASEGEHDQAIAAFSNAARIMKGSHLPLMHLGRAYHLTGATSISTRFMKSALAIAAHDPALLQEIGVMLANSGNHKKAEKYLKRAVTSLHSIDPHVTLQAWEPVYNNLGHVYRKLQKYDLALKMHHHALQLHVVSSETGTLTAIAFVHLLQADYIKVVEYCSRSLRLKREDQFTLELLNIAMEEIGRLPLELGGESLDVLEPRTEILELDKPSTSTAKNESNSSSSSDTAMVIE